LKALKFASGLDVKPLQDQLTRNLNNTLIQTEAALEKAKEDIRRLVQIAADLKSMKFKSKEELISYVSQNIQKDKK